MANAGDNARQPPRVPEHSTVRCIGEGSYGEVWLARNLVVGTYRAIKIIHRHKFPTNRPFDREFAGLTNYEPVSRTHPALVPVLQVGRDDAAGAFYYVMEVADDLERGQKIDPDTYNPKTLGRLLDKSGAIPVAQCFELAIALTEGMAHLHARGLVHRDIKPSNIIFIGGAAKFADVGLVARIGDVSSGGAGTIGYLAPDGLGTPQADVYSFGKVLYEMTMGKHCHNFPELPTQIGSTADTPALLRLNQIVLKACDTCHSRYQSAEELRDALVQAADNLGLLPQPKSERRRKTRSTARSPRGISAPAKRTPTTRTTTLESVGGAVPLASSYYVIRPTDVEFQDAITRKDSIVLVKGARQMGKTSLLARGLQYAREAGARVALTDFQKLNAADLTSIEPFFLTLGEILAEQAGIDVVPKDTWDSRRSPNINFERYLRREVLGKISGHLVWGLDEIDRLFTCSFGNEVFGLFRAWHNERALDPCSPWGRITLAIAYATEAHLFITDINQSPFNVGTRLSLSDFSLAQVRDLNMRYGGPVHSDGELNQLFDLLGGQPYLVRRALNELASGNMNFTELIAAADRDEGIFGDHLRRILVLLAKDTELRDTVRGILHGVPCSDAAQFYRLRSAGLMAGESPAEAHPRCRIYRTYLQRNLS